MLRIGKCWKNSRDVSSARLKLPLMLLPVEVVMAPEHTRSSRVIEIGLAMAIALNRRYYVLILLGGGGGEGNGGYYRPVPSEDESAKPEPKMKAASQILDKAMLKIDD